MMKMGRNPTVLLPLKSTFIVKLFWPYSKTKENVRFSLNGRKLKELVKIHRQKLEYDAMVIGIFNSYLVIAARSPSGPMADTCAVPCEAAWSVINP